MDFFYPELIEDIIKDMKEFGHKREEIAEEFREWQAESWLKYEEWEKRYEKKLKEEKD